MALRFYLVPKTIVTRPPGSTAPKYVGDQAFWIGLGLPLITNWAAMDYGLENTMLVGAQVSAAQQTTVAGQSDVTVIPANLDSAIGGALSAVQAALEALHIPAGWVTSGHTYRQVIGKVGRLFQILQRFTGRERRTFFESGVTLDTAISALTTAQRTALLATAQSLALDTSAITGATLMRQALKLVLDQLPAFTLMGETF